MKKIAMACLLCIPYFAFAAANPASTEWVENYVTNELLEAKQTLTYKVAQAVPGGVVFYTDSTKLHGMIVADMDASVEVADGLMPFVCSTGESPEHLFTSVTRGSGVGNTSAIISYVLQLSSSCQFAAAQANQFAVNTDDPSLSCAFSTQPNCLGGWTLPSAADLQILMSNLDEINASITAHGGTALAGKYWTSSLSTADYTKAYSITAQLNATATTEPLATLNRVRLIRYY